MSWEDERVNSPTSTLLLLCGLYMILVLLTWPLWTDRPAKRSGGGCCKVTEAPPPNASQSPKSEGRHIKIGLRNDAYSLIFR